MIAHASVYTCQKKEINYYLLPSRYNDLSPVQKKNIDMILSSVKEQLHLPRKRFTSPVNLL